MLTLNLYICSLSQGWCDCVPPPVCVCARVFVCVSSILPGLSLPMISSHPQQSGLNYCVALRSARRWLKGTLTLYREGLTGSLFTFVRTLLIAVWPAPLPWLWGPVCNCLSLLLCLHVRPRNRDPPRPFVCACVCVGGKARMHTHARKLVHIFMPKQSRGQNAKYKNILRAGKCQAGSTQPYKKKSTECSPYERPNVAPSKTTVCTYFKGCTYACYILF